jgi:hypothetical protein
LAITSIASNRLFSRHRLQQFRGACGNGEFGLQLSDAAAGSGEFSALDRAQPRLPPGIDELLVTAVVDGLPGDIETCGDPGNRAS